jgi:phage-related baseplate assembly protein
MTQVANDLKNFLTPDHVDLSSLPAPQIVEELSFETIFQELLADFRARRPEYDALLESDPVIIALECSAYRELLLRHRINEAAKANMLAYATGSDLDNLAAFYGIERMDAEADERLRYRTNLALEGLTTAGSEKAYLFHALSASPLVKSASVQSPNAGQVLITILSMEGNGTAGEELITAVKNYASDEDKRPLTDDVVVQSAEIISFVVNATIYVYPSPSVSITEEEYQARLQKYLEKQHALGGMIARSGIFNALHAEGVQKVLLTAPANDIITTKEQAAYCTNVSLQVVIINDTE